MAELPEFVLIGVQRFTILCDEADWMVTEHKEQNNSLLGCTQMAELEIHLKPGLPPTHQADTLLHEILHAILYMQEVPRILRGLKKSEDGEEITVCILAPLLHAVIVNNPGLVAYLADPDPSPSQARA